MKSIFSQLTSGECSHCGSKLSKTTLYCKPPSRPATNVKLASGERAIQGTLTEADIGTLLDGSFFDRVKDIDVGKRVYALLDSRFLQMENNEQRDARKAQTP